MKRPSEAANVEPAVCHENGCGPRSKFSKKNSTITKPWGENHLIRQAWPMNAVSIMPTHAAMHWLHVNCISYDNRLAHASLLDIAHFFINLFIANGEVSKFTLPYQSCVLDLLLHIFPLSWHFRAFDGFRVHLFVGEPPWKCSRFMYPPWTICSSVYFVSFSFIGSSWSVVLIFPLRFAPAYVLI